MGDVMTATKRDPEAIVKTSCRTRTSTGHSLSNQNSMTAAALSGDMMGCLMYDACVKVQGPESADSNDLGIESEVLRDTQDAFGQLLRTREMHRNGIRITCFYEEKASFAVGMDMIKFAKRDDPGYNRIIGKMRRWVKHVKSENMKLRGSTFPASITQDVLWALSFKDMSNRIGLIQRPFAGTLDWIWSCDAYIFARWLRSGPGLFWISASPKSCNITDMGMQLVMNLLRRAISSITGQAVLSVLLRECSGASYTKFSRKGRLQLAKCLTTAPSHLFRVEEHTKDGIRFYVSERFEEAKPVLGNRHKTLLQPVIDRARGVFLCIQLVVDSLQRGWRRYDTVSSLKKRLNDMPQDLVALYQRILDELDPEERAEVYRMLRIVGAAKWPLTAFQLYCATYYSAIHSVGTHGIFRLTFPELFSYPSPDAIIDIGTTRKYSSTPGMYLLFRITFRSERPFSWKLVPSKHDEWSEERTDIFELGAVFLDEEDYLNEYRNRNWSDPDAMPTEL
ncbi:hypothetical protein DM02DRAFT_672735 [Periconia macrospinosa]|uniref:Heterokaryon incompatibility domain-containing protein n=1 Tax=Periconia macrospinosa TaxID=97972 RepID=A0A2V1DMQ6_9PLEO|nr:hypothetical protein DM02DRAFT_672735 [Periconia macrospinosa]